MKTYRIGLLVAVLAAVSRCGNSVPDPSAGVTPLPKHIERSSPVATVPTPYTLLAGVVNVVTAQVLPDALCVLQTGSSGGAELVSDNQGNVSFQALFPQAGEVTQPTLSCSTTAGLTASYTLELTSAEGVPALTAPPPQGTVRPPLQNPESADITDDQLRAGGYPKRPDPTTAPDLYQRWLTAVSTPGIISNQVPGRAPPMHGQASTETAIWAGAKGYKGTPPLWEVVGVWYTPTPPNPLPSLPTNMWYQAAMWDGLGDGTNVGGTMWQAGTATTAWTEEVGGVFVSYGKQGFWSQVVGATSASSQVPFTPVPSNNDGVNVWLWFSGSSNCSGVSITGNNATQYLGIQIYDYNTGVTYGDAGYCNTVQSQLPGTTPVTGGSAEWILERMTYGCSTSMGPPNCTCSNAKTWVPLLLPFPSSSTYITYAQAADTYGWHAVNNFSDLATFYMENTSSLACSYDDTDGTVLATSAVGSEAVSMFFNSSY